jgi:hypothetical protein
MEHKFTPIKFSEENPGVVKINELTGNYSTHISPYDFEIEESNDMFICGKEYFINESKAIELYECGYGEFITPPVNIQEEVPE